MIIVLLLGLHSIAAQAQPLVGILFPDNAAARGPMLAAFEGRLRELGYEPGRNLRLDVRYGEASAERLRLHAQALAASDARIVVVAGTAPAVTAEGIILDRPLLFVGVGDPVARGFLKHFEAPEGRMTGSTDMLPEVTERRLALLTELLPGIKRVAIIANTAITPVGTANAAAAKLGLELLHIDVRGATDFGSAYDTLAAAKPQALLVTPNPVTFAERHRLARFGREQRIAVMFGWREYMDAGGLVALGPHMAQLYILAADQLHRLLQGTPVARVPTEYPRADLSVDMRTAKMLGIVPPATVLQRANLILE
jgi:putative ABC transport system substrate-binding protein